MRKFIQKYPIVAAMVFVLLWISVVKFCKAPPVEGEKLLMGRAWLDKLPKNPKETFHLWMWTPRRAGAYQERTFFKGAFEVFFFLHNAENIKFLFPDSQKRVESTYKIEQNCDAPRPFDLCLTLENAPYGPKKYYSMRQGEQVEHLLEEAVSHSVHFDTEMSEIAPMDASTLMLPTWNNARE